MSEVPFTKVVGTGNDFVVVDARDRRVKRLAGRWEAVSRAWCDRRTGIGADGVLVLEPSRTADVVMRVFNPDGSEAEMCGNGARCVALYEAHSRLRQRRIRPWRKHTAHSKGRNGHVSIETKAGVLTATVKDGRVAMRMTDPVELRQEFSVHVVEVCRSCSWNHLVQSYVLGAVPAPKQPRRPRSGSRQPNRRTASE